MDSEILLQSPSEAIQKVESDGLAGSTSPAPEPASPAPSSEVLQSWTKSKNTTNRTQKASESKDKGHKNGTKPSTVKESDSASNKESKNRKISTPDSDYHSKKSITKNLLSDSDLH